MFSRDRAAEGPQCVEITLQDGQALKGKLVLPPGRTLSEALNGATSFVEFEPFEGARAFLAKSSLRLVTPINVPPNPTLGAGAKTGESMDPHAVLGLAPGACKEDVRTAYLKLAKSYHPDRYATVDLPPEVGDYIAAMARRINAAHDAIVAKLRDRPVQEEPVFSTDGRS